MADTFKTLDNGLYVGVRPDGSMYTAATPGQTGRHFDLAVDPTTQHSYVGTGGGRNFMPTTQDLQAAHDRSGFVSSYDFDPKTADLKRSTNWGNIIGVGAVAAPFAAATIGALAGGTALGASGAAGGAAGSAAGASGAAGAGAGMTGFGWGDAIKLGTNVFGNIFGAHQATSAANHAAEITAAASRYATDQQTAASQREEQFLRDQAEAGYQNAETTRRANYDQWAAREQRVGSIADALGYGPRSIPAYVPSVDPRFQTATASYPAGSVGSYLH